MKVRVIPKKQKEIKRSYPCLLKGLLSKDIFLAVNRYEGLNLSRLKLVGVASDENRDFDKLIYTLLEEKVELGNEN